MNQREWSMPAQGASQGRPGQSSNASAPSRPWGGRELVAHFVLLMVFCGLVGWWLSSWFPVAFGLFLFLTDDQLIEWVLHKIGIRLVPDTLGPEFIKAFVFLFGLWILLAYWRESAPEWLLQWMPPGVPWYFIGGVAFGCAVLRIISVAIVRKLLPQIGIEISPARQGWAILAVLGALVGLMMLALLIFTT